MGICRKPKTTRWSEEEIADIDMLNEKYSPFTNGFSSVLRLAVRVLKAFTLTPDKVMEYLQKRQQLQGMTSYDARQMNLLFPIDREQGFFPKFGGRLP